MKTLHDDGRSRATRFGPGREPSLTARLKRRYPSVLAIALVTAWSSAPFAAGPLRADEVVNGNCLDTIAGGSQNCTANDGPDLTLGITNISDITLGCVNNTSSVQLVKFQITLHQQNAGTRYDVGTWINSDASSAQSGPNGTCSRFGLFPAGTLNSNACPPWDLDSGSGPYVNADGDSCGDIIDTNSSGCNQNASGSPWDDTIYNTLTPLGITVLCSDPAGTGFVRVPTCNTWSQQANAVDDPADAGNTCNSSAEFGLGTTAKCNCGTEDTNIPAPNLTLACSCSPTTVRVGDFANGHSTECTVTFDNNATCTPNLSTAEELRCGAAAFMQFDTVADTPNGSHIFGQNDGGAPTETTAGTINIGTPGTIRWTPRDTVATGGGTGLGIIGQNQTGSMTFDYFVDQDVPDNTTINFVTTAYWANNSSFSNRTAQPLTATCSVTTDVDATWAHVSSFGAREDAGRVVVEWETAGEVGTVAFEVERRDPASGRFEKITEKAVPAVAQLPGGRYRLVDATAPRGEKLTYRLVEIDQRGKRAIFGPYRVAVRAEGRRAGKDDRDFTARGKAVSPRILEGAVERQAARTATVVAGEKAQKAARAKIEVTGDGIVKLKTRDLAFALGMTQAEAAAQIQAGNLRLTHRGQEAAWQADGDGLLFYAEAIDSPYTFVNVYWLERGRGRSMATVAARPASGPAAGELLDTLHLETDAIPALTAPLPVEDFWIWKSFFPGFPGFDRETFAVAVPTPGSGGATLTVNLYGFAAVQRARVRLNGRVLGELSWEGNGPYTTTLPVPARTLRATGGNEIEILAREGERGFWLDSFELTYSRRYRAVSHRLAFRAEPDRAVALSGFKSSAISIYDVSQPLSPKRLTGLAAQPQPDGTWGVTFFAPGAGPFLALTGQGLGGAAVRGNAAADLRNPGSGAEYLVITPDLLSGESKRLAGLRAAQGLSTMVVDLDDVIDVFAHGIYDPLAIQRFLAYAVENWPTPPRYVALAGKGTYDYRNILGLYSNLLPPFLVTTGDGLAPADAEFADFDGSGVPALAIGRIPAVTAADMRAYVDKLAAYESGPGGVWTNQALLVADDADTAGDFPGTSDALAKTFAPGLDLSRIYLPPGRTFEMLQTSRTQLVEALRRGQVLMNYIGHGGLDRLESGGLLLSSDVPQLGNAPGLPVMTALTCLISEFAYPSISSLGEELVLQGNGGVAALFGPTWLSFNGPATELGRHLLPELSKAGGGRLGDRVLRGLAAFKAAGGDRDTLRVYTLLGDPALAIKR